MKTLILLIIFTIGYMGNILAQTVEIKVENTTFEYDTISQIIQNKENVVFDKKPSHDCEYMKVDSSNIMHIAKNVFSRERARQFENKTLIITVYCDNEGKIIEVGFRTLGIYSIIRFSELKALEDVLKEKGYLKVKSDCEKYSDYYYRISSFIRFGQLYRDE